MSLRKSLGPLRRRIGARNLTTQFAALRMEVESLRAQFDRQRVRLAKRGRQVDTLLEARKASLGVDRQRTRSIRLLERDLERMGYQLAALETRFDARTQAEADPSAVEVTGDPLVDGARACLDEIRREHDQIRVRFRVITAYEERMRRLEVATFGVPGAS